MHSVLNRYNENNSGSFIFLITIFKFHTCVLLGFLEEGPPNTMVLGIKWLRIEDAQEA